MQTWQETMKMEGVRGMIILTLPVKRHWRMIVCPSFSLQQIKPLHPGGLPGCFSGALSSQKGFQYIFFQPAVPVSLICQFVVEYGLTSTLAMIQVQFICGQPNILDLVLEDLLHGGDYSGKHEAGNKHLEPDWLRHHHDHIKVI
jgi:hypothetical protein